MGSGRVYEPAQGTASPPWVRSRAARPTDAAAARPQPSNVALRKAAESESSARLARHAAPRRSGGLPGRPAPVTLSVPSPPRAHCLFCDIVHHSLVPLCVCLCRANRPASLAVYLVSSSRLALHSRHLAHSMSPLNPLLRCPLSTSLAAPPHRLLHHCDFSIVCSLPAAPP